MQPLLKQNLQELQRIVLEIEQEFKTIKDQSQEFKKLEATQLEHKEQALKIKNECQHALDVVVPALNVAMENLSQLNKIDFAELRSMKNPPGTIVSILKIVCIFLSVEPIEAYSEELGRVESSYWHAAIGTQVLGNPNLMDDLLKLDKNKITPEQIESVEKIINDEGVDFEKAQASSKAAVGLLKWIKATRDYYYIFREIEPRRNAFMLAKKQYEAKLEEYQNKKLKVSQLDEALASLKDHQTTKDQVIKTLQDRILEYSVRKKSVDVLLKGLNSEK